MTKVMLLAITIIDSPKPGRLPVAPLGTTANCRVKVLLIASDCNTHNLPVKCKNLRKNGLNVVY